MVINILFSTVGLLCLLTSLVVCLQNSAKVAIGQDKPAVCHKTDLNCWVGSWIGLIGLYTVVYPWLMKVNVVLPMVWMLAYVLPILIMLCVLTYGAHRFERNKSS